MVAKNDWVAGDSYTNTAANALADEVNAKANSNNPTLTAPVIAAHTTSAGSAMKLTSGTVMTTPEAGAVEYDGTVFYMTTNASNRGLSPVYVMCRQDTSYTLTSNTSVQKLFNASANGRVTLPLGTYRFNCLYSLSAMSATSGNSAFSLAVSGGSAIGTVLMYAQGQDSATAAAAAQSASMAVTAAFPASQHTAGTATGQQSYIVGTFEVTTAGLVIPSVQLVTASAAVVAAGSFFECWSIGGTSMATVGNWS